MQGLVKVCFPQGPLVGLGIEIVTQHMRDEEAAEDNIAKTAEILRSGIFHRVTWILAEYLDAPLKVGASIKAITAASASLHDDEIGEDVLVTMISSLQKLRKYIPEESTEHV